MIKASTPQPFGRLSPDGTGMPLFRAVERDLLGAIEASRFGPGAALPSEAKLAEAFGVSVGTVRKAVDELVAEHIVVRRQGRGTFVATPGAGRLMFQFFHVERGDGLRERPVIELVAFDRGRADEASAQALGLKAGEPVAIFENVLKLQGRAVIHDRIVVAAALFRGLNERRLRDRPGTIYQYYQAEFGITVLRAHERARAVAADRSAARALGIAAGTPVIEVRRTALSFNDRPVELRVSVIDTTRHDYVNTLSRPAAPAAAALP